MHVGIIGLGTMGSGIAQVVAQAGFKVTAVEVSEAACQEGLNRIHSFLEGGVQLGKVASSDIDRVLGAISTTTNYSHLVDCEVVIEAAVEDIEIKRRIFSQLEHIVSPKTVLATNTSGIAIHQISRVLSRSNRLVGLHFFNPAQLMRLVEIVLPTGFPSSEVERIRQFCLDIGKEPVVVKDRPGFLVNRLLIPYLNLAIEAFDQGLATREDIDTAIELGLGYPLGPLKLLDQIGLDVHLHATTTIYGQTYWPDFRPPALLRELVDTGRLGKKSGSGFYNYGPDSQL